MNKYRIGVTVSKRIELEIEAESPDHVNVLARDKAQALHPGFHASVGLAVQTEGPWLSCAYWYPLAERGDIIVVERAVGHEFTKAQVNTLLARVESLDLSVVRWWNGAGCSTLSIKAAGRVGTGPLTQDQRSALMAPI